MKQKLLRLMLLPAIVCSLLVVGSFATAGSAHAATLQSHVSLSPATISSVPCNFTSDTQVQIATNYNPNTGGKDWVCFQGYGWHYTSLYNVFELYTGPYTLTWDWEDCNGAMHHSTKGPYTYLMPWNASGSGLYAGYNVMCDITSIALS